MTVKELIEKLSSCNPNARLKIIQEEELECMPEWWDDKIGACGSVSGSATEIYSEDLHSHQMYLLAIEK